MNWNRLLFAPELGARSLVRSSLERARMVFGTFPCAVSHLEEEPKTAHKVWSQYKLHVSTASGNQLLPSEFRHDIHPEVSKNKSS